MAEIITMPRLSDTMEEGTVVKWHKNIGDKVSDGDIIAEIETDKAIQEFESEFDGILLYQGVQEGGTTKVDNILAIIGESGEDISNLTEGGKSKKNEDSEEKTNEEFKNDKKEIVAELDNAEVITMPRLSDTMEEGTVVKWHKNTGDKISEGDVLAEIETDKAVQEFESEFDGVLLYQGIQEGGTTKVDSILAIIGEEGTDINKIINGEQNESSSSSSDRKEKNTSVKEENTQKNKTKENTSSERIFASPLAKTIAKDKGINLTEIRGSGDNGRIIKKDIDNYKTSNPKINDNPNRDFSSGKDIVSPNSQMRKVIAKRLAESKFTAPHYYLNIELDMDNTIKARKQLNTIPNTKISFNDIVIKAVAMALRKHPAVNSTWTDTEIIQHGDINIGVAVAVEDGLLVPVVKNTDQKSLTQISTEVKDYASRARERKLKADEMEKSTFSVSNLGMFGIESFTSIINQPNSCILSVGAIIEKPVIKDGQIVVGNTMKLSLACDHRTVDGATGAQFLQTLRTYIENPVTMLM